MSRMGRGNGNVRNVKSPPTKAGPYCRLASRSVKANACEIDGTFWRARRSCCRTGPGLPPRFLCNWRRDSKQWVESSRRRGWAARLSIGPLGRVSQQSGILLMRILSGSDCMGQEKRRSERYPFFASAELIEDKSDVRITTRLSELGLYGCYLDMMNPFPAGTSVLIKISESPATFEARATVVYSQPNMGMGVAFQNVEERYLKVLQKWMTDAQNR